MYSFASHLAKVQANNVYEWEEELEKEVLRCLHMQTILQFEHSQTETTLEININLPGIHEHPESLIEWEIRNTSLKVNLKDFHNSHRIFRINRLLHRVDVEKSTFSVCTDEIRFVLKKEEPKAWSSVIYLPEEVRAKFEEKYSELLKSILPSVGKIPDEIEKKWRCKSDIMADNYFEPWICSDSTYSLHFPPSISSPQDKIKFVEEKMRDTFNPEQFGFIIDSTLYKINEEFEAANPDHERNKGRKEKRKSNISSGDDTEEKRKAEKLKEDGNKHFRAGRFNEAIKSFTKAIDMASGCASYFYNRGLAYMQIKDYRSSYQDNCRCLSLNPFHCKAYIAIIKHKMARGDFPYASIYLHVLRSINPHISGMKELVENMKEKEKNLKLFIQSMITDEFQKTFSLLGSILEVQNCWINPIRVGVHEVCNRNKTDKARKFVSELTEYLHANWLFRNLMRWDSDIFFLQGLISYHEGNEEAVHLNFRKSLQLLDDDSTKYEYDRIKRILILYNLGNEALSNGQLVSAVELFSACIELDPESIVNARYLYKIAEVKQRQGRMKEAISTLSSAIDKRSDFADALSMRGELYLVQGKYEQAINDFETAFGCSPCDKYRQQIKNAQKKVDQSFSKEKVSLFIAEALKEKGNSFYRQKMFQDAIECYSEALSVNPKCPTYLTNRSACYIALNRFSDGLRDAKEAVKIDATFIKGFIRFGKCHLALGEVQDAMEAFAKAQNLSPSHEDVLNGLVKVKKLKDSLEKAEKAVGKENYEEALDFFNDASKIAYGCGLLFLKRTECLVHLQRIKEIDILVESVPEGLKENSYILCMIALHCFHQNKKADTIEHLRKAVQIDASNKKALELLGHVELVYEKLSNGKEAWIMGSIPKALQLFQEGLELEPLNVILQAKFHLQIGIMWMSQNKTRDAINSFSNALKLKNDCKDSLECRGKCFLEVKETKNAAEDFAKLCRLQPCPPFFKMLQDTVEVEYGRAKDYYQILGVSRDATFEDIRKSYKKLAMQFDPVRLSSEVEKLIGQKRFQEISEAFNVLGDPLKKFRYDSEIGGGLFFRMGKF